MPSPLLEITGTARDRYIQAVTLLSILNPVRSDPTTHGLDQDSPSVHGPLDLGLKRKFLDAFALICASTKDAKCISAACFDKDHPSTTTIRVASNGGVSNRTLIYLEQILENLTHLSRQDVADASAMTDMMILDKIIHLDKSRIEHYVKELQKAKLPDHDTVTLQSALSAAPQSFRPDAIQSFIVWLKELAIIRSSRGQPGPELLFGWVCWAEKARRKYLKLLRAVFAGADKSFPRWMSFIFKLGRYSVAARVLVKTAVEIPAMFNSISIEPIKAPPVVKYRTSAEEKPLLSVLRRIPEVPSDQTLENLARLWSTDDPEQVFSDKCADDLIVHAELQILSFYDDNKHLKPISRFIGVSKKSCYLCSTFLAYHPGGFTTSSCHQKMYLSIPPSTTSPKVYQRFKDLTKQLCVRLESIAREELVERFGYRQDRMPADSTAGITFTGSSETVPW